MSGFFFLNFKKYAAPPPARATTRTTTRMPFLLLFFGSGSGSGSWSEPGSASGSGSGSGGGSFPAHWVISTAHTAQEVLTAPAAHLSEQEQAAGAAVPSSISASRSASST